MVGTRDLRVAPSCRREVYRAGRATCRTATNPSSRHPTDDLTCGILAGLPAGEVGHLADLDATHPGSLPRGPTIFASVRDHEEDDDPGSS